MEVNSYCYWKVFENIFKNEIISRVYSKGIDISLSNLNSIPIVSTETPLQLHSNFTPWIGNGVEFE